MERRNVSGSSGRRVGVAIALLVAGACSGSDDSGDGADVADTAGGSAESDGTTSSVAADDGTDGSSTDDEGGSADPPAAEQPTGPLGFATDVFDIPIPADADPEFGAFEDANELIDAGVDAGVWTEVEGVRALVSVVMGELQPAAIPALDDLTRFHYREVIDRAIDLLDDPAVDAEQAADLARLTAFFTAESLGSTESEIVSGGSGSGGSGEGASGSTRMITPVGLRPNQLPDRCNGPPELVVYTIDEEGRFAAEPSLVCYFRFEQGDDVVWVANHEDAIDISALVFDVIDKARPGYQALAGTELQSVEMLVSLDPSPPDPDQPNAPPALAHVASESSERCRVAIFASDTLATGTPHLEFTIAHELFHCIQDVWRGARPSDFVSEAGADYFAYEVLGKLCTAPQVGLGIKLDTKTANGSLLDTRYEGWFFWAYLAEHGHLAPQLIAQTHEGIYNGAPIEESLLGSIGDPAAVLNEFFVRLVGPGLACDFKGSKVTREIPVKDKGEYPLEVKEVWHGTRYKLKYDKKKLFEQSGDDAGPIGMAEFAKRGDEGAWVITEPEVRTTCDDEEPWIVVVSPPAVGVSAPRKLEVDEVKPGGCDPCLIGSWSVDIAAYESLLESQSPTDIDVVGEYTLTFGAGPPVGDLEFSDLRQTLMAFPDTGTAIGVAVETSGSGTYTAQDNLLKSDGYVVTGRGSAVGAPIPAVADPFSVAGDGAASYICEGDDLAVVIGDVTLDAVRDPATPEGTPYFD